MCCGVFFFFKQKTAYEMRISDWSSDVCSSDLLPLRADAPSMADPTVQLNHVMGASFRKRRILNKTEARVFFAVEKALEQTDTGWRVMAQVNLGEILESDDKHAFMAINSKRSEERRVGKECVSTCRSRWSQDHRKKKK